MKNEDLQHDVKLLVKSLKTDLVNSTKEWKERFITNDDYMTALIDSAEYFIRTLKDLLKQANK